METNTLTTEQSGLMDVLLDAYATVDYNDGLFKQALIISQKAKSFEEAETILYALKLYKQTIEQEDAPFVVKGRRLKMPSLFKKK